MARWDKNGAFNASNGVLIHWRSRTSRENESRFIGGALGKKKTVETIEFMIKESSCCFGAQTINLGTVRRSFMSDGRIQVNNGVTSETYRNDIENFYATYHAARGAQQISQSVSALMGHRPY